MISHRLVIDTSIFGAAVGVAATDSSDLEHLEMSDTVADSARQLPDLVAKCLAKIGISFASISDILVSRGPGSFTGIRVGLAYAFGLKSGLVGGPTKPRLTGISSLQLLAESQARGSSIPVGVFLPSTKTLGYMALSGVDRFQLEAVDLDHLSDSSLRWLHGAQNARMVSIGPWDVLQRALVLAASRPVEILAPKTAAESAIKEMVRRATTLSDLDWDARELSPLYLRRSTVEEKALLGVTQQR
jgi:tRNA threonylcarbamoyl adenosine modification protein YeaZ